MNLAILILHIAAGTVAMAAGAIALFALKGGNVHRKSGVVFVYAMLPMAAIGGTLAAIPHQGLGGEWLPAQRPSVVAGALAFYLVVTALLTVRRRSTHSRWLDAAGMVVAAAIALPSLALAFANGLGGTIDGLPVIPMFVFGAIALLAALGDLRVVLANGLRGAQRIARHLWRMCFALFLANISFFLGQAKVFPESLREPFLLAIPVLLVLILMFYWLARVLVVRRTHWQSIPSDAMTAAARRDS